MARIEKVNEVIKREISNILQLGEVKDPRISFVTILNVEVSKDLQHARVKFSTLSDRPMDIKNAEEGFNSCRGFIRKLVGSRIEMRYTPELNFIYDKGLQYAAQVDKTLAEIKELEEKEGKANG